MMFISVDLPEPEAPTIETNSPRPTCRSMPIEDFQLIGLADVKALVDPLHVNDQAAVRHGAPGKFFVAHAQPSITAPAGAAPPMPAASVTGHARE